VNVALLSIGDELLGGRITDTNAEFLSREVTALGASVVERAVVPDERTAIGGAIGRLAGVADVLVCTGGLGPTTDDLSRWAAADLLDTGEVIDDEEVAAAVRTWCDGVGVPMTEVRAVVAKRPPSAAFVSNDQGTAPGLHFRLGSCDVWMLPGPPVEMGSMFRRHVAEVIGQEASAARPIEVRAAGLTEVQASDLLGDRLDRTLRPQLGIRVGGGLVRVTAQDPDGLCTQSQVNASAEAARKALRHWSLPADCEALAEAVGVAVQGRGWTCVTAESCTGGGIAAALTAVPGSSAWFLGGFVTYANDMKVQQLGVCQTLLSPSGPGAVSAEVVEAMAAKARLLSGADVAVSVSGIAGPDGGSPDKPVGTVWVGLSDSGGTESRCLRVPGDRSKVRSGTVDAAMQWMRWRASGVVERLPWERAQ